MKALFIGNDSSVFDTESATRERMRSYANAIGTLHIVSRGRGAHAAEYGKGMVDGSLTLHAVGGGKVLALLRTIARAKKLIREQNIEIVSAQDPFEYGWAALRAVHGTSAKLHLQVHTDFLSPQFVRVPSFSMVLLNRVRRTIAGMTLPHAAGVRVVSERVKRSIMECYGAKVPEPSVLPIALPIDVPAVVALPKHAFTFTLVTVGRLEAEKRMEDMVTALARLPASYARTVGLFIIGAGRSRRKLERRVQTLGLESRVVFLGSRSDAWGLMRSASAYIQASAYEGYGRTLLEAALARIPIITTDVGIVGDVLISEEEVLSVPVGQPDALRDCTVRLIEDNGLRHALAMRAAQKALAHTEQYSNLPRLMKEDLERTLSRI